MDTRDFSVDTIQEIYDIIETLKDQGTLWDSIHDYWCIGEPDAGMLCTYASRDEMTEYYEKYADGMNLTKKKFERIVENVREVDSKYQEVFLESKEELKNVGEMLKNMTEEISLRTVSLDTNHYNQAIGIIEGEDNEKKEELKALIGIAPGTTQESKLLQKIREILKYSVGNGGFEDEIEVESEEASIAQKQKLITQVENLKEKFKNKELTQEELLDKICEIYHVEDYGSQINYSLAFKKYSPEKKARIVSDILSTAMYIMEVDGLDAEKIEEIAQSVKAKSYIEDEIWNMAEHVFRGAVMGVNTAVAGKYYTGQAGSGKHSLSNVEARRWYLEQEAKIPDMIDKSLTLEEQAKQAFNLRNQFRTQARELMADRATAESLYKIDPNLTWEEIVRKQSEKGLEGDDIYKAIIESSQRSRKSVNKSLGLE